ncbi:MAG: T9SS type A sorting domain-containing protein [Saprospiraceae bacterium]
MKLAFYIQVFILSNLLFHTSGLAQSEWYKVYPSPTSASARQMLEYQGRYFVLIVKICDFGNFIRECSTLQEIDINGTILWEEDIPEIDVANTMVIKEGIIHIFGNNNPQNTKLLHIQFDLEGNRMYYKENPLHDPSIHSMFWLNATSYEENILVTGAGKLGDSTQALIYVINSEGIIDTTILIGKNRFVYAPRTMFVDSRNFLTLMLEIENGPGEDHRKIIQYNPDFEVVWSVTTPYKWSDRINPYGNELHDGRLIMACNVKDDTYDIGGVCCYNRDSTLSWQFEQPYNRALERFIYRLKVTRNGDIVGCGVYSDQKYDPIIRRSPFFFRMSPDGEMLWERVYFDIDPRDGESRIGSFWDIEELEDGGLMLVGYTNNDNADVLWLRTDSTGCIDPGCGEVNILDLTSDTEDVDREENKIHVFPNPISNEGFSVYIKDISEHEIYEIKVFDQLGLNVYSGVLTKNVTQIPGFLKSGVYFVDITINGLSVSKQKLIKS